MAGQSWQFNDEGGYFANPDLSRKMRHAAQPMIKFSQFVRPEPGLGKGKGDTLDFNKVTNLVTPGGKLQEDKPMRTSQFKVLRASLVVDEWGNSVPYTGKLDALSEFNVNDPVQQALLNDQAKVLDNEIAAFYKAGGIFYVPLGTVGTPTNLIVASTTGLPTTDPAMAAQNATRNVQMFDVESVRDYMMDTLLVPPMEDGNYISIGHTVALRGIKNDSKFIEAAKYGDPERLFAGEVGRIEGVRFIETNNRGALYRHGTGSPGVCGGMVFFGMDSVVQGTVIPPELRAKRAQDYGRDQGIAWYGLLGWATPWRFHKGDGEARIVWVTSNNETLLPPAGY